MLQNRSSAHLIHEKSHDNLNHYSDDIEFKPLQGGGNLQQTIIVKEQGPDDPTINQKRTIKIIQNLVQSTQQN